jgi:FkbM family methyltransferase
MEQASQTRSEKIFISEYVLSNGMVFSGNARTPIAALVREIFHDEVYAGAFSGIDSPVVLDLGANVGVFAVWASMPDRGATVYAVEPVPSSFSLLRTNMLRLLGASAPYPIQAAVAKSAGNPILYLDRSASCDTLIAPPSPELAQRVVGTVTVEALTLAAVYDRFSLPSCDILKIDIEGSECGVLNAASDDELRKARRVIVETHDYLVPGGSALVRARLASAGFDVCQGATGELLMGVRK